MKKKLAILIFGMSIPFAAACGQEATKDSDSHTAHTHTTANGDLQEVTASADTLPSFLDNKDDNMRAVYRAAAKHADVLDQMPCYCGCGESAGHRSNLNCFIAERNGDEITWDDHGTRCGVCLDIAATTAAMTEEGKSPSDIRSYIDHTYSEGYAEPTPTPLPGA
ncbi:PCYCGC motif-containing (lipo)protein [Domibacillus robiginosus]|uniref:PCYCGC motif-containing (lipo)protein n=1 Tax=Domibacillus robiginosus TaxID=1071054 RepID=UPI00067D01B6|nr:PCYCGC motif-containing (lipo)protein [Domibacillus robiginosus]